MFRFSMISKTGLLTAIVGVVVMIAAMGVASAGAPEPAAARRRVLFTWTGSDADAWRDASHWSGVGGFGYPDDTNDDAVIDAFTGTFDIGLSASTTIDDLAVTQDAATLRITNGSAVTLTCDSIVIDCTDSSGFLRLVAHDLVKIETN